VATLLLYGAQDFGRADWSEEHLRRADCGNRRVRAVLASLATALGAEGPQATERVALAVVDLPLSLVRRHLRAGASFPAYAEDVAEECSAALLGSLPAGSASAPTASAVGRRTAPGSSGGTAESPYG